MFELSYLGGRIHAEAYEQSGQFVVMAGATFRHPDFVTKAIRGSLIQKLKYMLEDGRLITAENLPEDIVQLTQDLMCSSSSTAATLICGTSMSGPWHWKIKGGSQTYGEWRQAQLDAIQPVELEPEMALAGVR
jgi:hypothetical protein